MKKEGIALNLLLKLVHMDWSSELPLDLLHLISKKLPDLSDFIRFRAVCKRWHTAAPVTDPPRQLPWVVATREGLPSTIRFFSLSSGKIYSINFSKAEGKRLLGSSHHYMLAFDHKRCILTLLNPITRNEIPLPPTNSYWHRPIFISGDDVVVCWESSGIRTVGLCQPGDREWKKIQIPSGANGQMYYKGLYYVNEKETLTTKVMDIKTGATMSTIPPLIISKITGEPRRLDYLIVSTGELLGVCRSKWAKTVRDSKFEVYRLDEENKVPQWVKIDSIGDRVLFLDDTIGFSLKASEFQGLKGDSIYFIAYLYPVDRDDLYEYPLCRYNMKNGRAEAALGGDLVNMSSWFFPSI
ncbi:F-box protein [Carex littledalei]|uniref:F-box protein n=1 Tax=Carex littledalei TaxID=544730 RepID=A0A833V9B7_9POAL|nr:F-box protein [Carex littledalei]